MKKICKSLILVFFLMVFATVAQANETMEIGENVTVIGVVVVMDDGMYLDDGSRLFLLIEMEDPQHEGLTAEVSGQLILIDDQPAIKVEELVILEDVPAGGDSEETPASNG